MSGRPEAPADEAGPAGALEEDLLALRGALKDEPQRPVWSAAFGVTVLIAVAFAAIGWLWLDRDRPAAAALIYDQGVVAEAEAGAWMGQALSQAIAAHLSGSQGARIVNAGHHAGAEDLDIPVENVRGVTGADWLVGGAVAPGPDGGVILSLTLTDLRTGEAAHSADLRGAPGAVGDLASRAALQLLAWLGAAPLTADQLARANAGLPFDSPAGPDYAAALAALDRRDGRAAEAHLDAAIRLAPDHPALHDAHSRAWALLGYRDRAAAAARRAFDLSGALGQAHRLAIEARYLQTQDAWPRAVEIWRALNTFYPENIGYGLALANAQIGGDDFDGALATAAALRDLPEPMAADPRIDLLEADIYNHMGRYADSAAAAARAADAARAIGARAVLADAQLAAVVADIDDKRARLDEARRLYEALDIPRGQAVALKELADLEFAAGRLSAGADLYRQSIAVARRSGNAPQQSASENALAIAYDLMGRLEDGYRMKLRVADYYRERGVRSRHSIMLENLGISLFKLGRYDEALARFDEALIIFEEIGDEIGVAWAPYHRGRIALRRGDLDGGRALIDQALANAEQRPEGGLEVQSRFERMVATTLAGRDADALTQARQVRDLFQQMDLSLDVAETEIYVARAALSLGDIAAAAEALDAADALLADSDDGYYLAQAQTVRVDLALGADAGAAAEACRRLAGLARGQEHTLVRLGAQVRLAACDVWAFGAAPGPAEARLAALAGEADAAGLFEPAFDALEMRARLLARSDRMDEARRLLSDLSDRAGRSGWRRARTECLTDPPSRPCVAAAVNPDL